MLYRYLVREDGCLIDRLELELVTAYKRLPLKSPKVIDSSATPPLLTIEGNKLLVKKRKDYPTEFIPLNKVWMSAAMKQRLSHRATGEERTPLEEQEEEQEELIRSSTYNALYDLRRRVVRVFDNAMAELEDDN